MTWAVVIIVSVTVQPQLLHLLVLLYQQAGHPLGVLLLLPL
jgi:hypothetical protein